MQIGLIQPAMGREGAKYVASWKMEPLAMATLAALTPRGHELTFWDDRVEPIPYDDVGEMDLVAITVETYTARRAYQIAQQIRRRGVPVVMGGYHATLMPDEVACFADAVVIGEAELVWWRVMEDAQRGTLQPRYQATQRIAPGAWVRPDRSIFAGKRYVPITLVESGRGCKFACDFCSIAAFFESTFEPRPNADLAREIVETGNKWVFLVDDNVTADFARAKALCRELEPLNVRWVSQATITTGRDPELMELLDRSGCAGILIGFESLEPANLKAMNKSFNKGVAEYRELLKPFHDRGFKIYATFVFGYDEDSPEVYERTLDFALEQDFCLAAFNHLQPFPGTPLYKRLEAEGRLLYDRWWLKEGYRFGQLVFRPKGQAPEALFERLMDLRRRFYSRRNILRRALSSPMVNLFGPGAFWLYLSSNLLLRKELDEKWALPIGDLSEPLDLSPLEKLRS